jgi:hypothetical protein
MPGKIRCTLSKNVCYSLVATCAPYYFIFLVGRELSCVECYWLCDDSYLGNISLEVQNFPLGKDYTLLPYLCMCVRLIIVARYINSRFLILFSLKAPDLGLEALHSSVLYVFGRIT